MDSVWNGVNKFPFHLNTGESCERELLATAKYTSFPMVNCRHFLANGTLSTWKLRNLEREKIKKKKKRFYKAANIYGPGHRKFVYLWHQASTQNTVVGWERGQTLLNFRIDWNSLMKWKIQRGPDSDTESYQMPKIKAQWWIEQKRFGLVTSFLRFSDKHLTLIRRTKINIINLFSGITFAHSTSTTVI